MIHLKSKAGKLGTDMKFALLVRPNVPWINSDEELYEAVRKVGLAVIAPLEMMKVGKETTLTPEEFERTWRGD